MRYSGGRGASIAIAVAVLIGGGCGTRASIDDIAAAAGNRPLAGSGPAAASLPGGGPHDGAVATGAAQPASGHGIGANGAGATDLAANDDRSPAVVEAGDGATPASPAETAPPAATPRDARNGGGPPAPTPGKPALSPIRIASVGTTSGVMSAFRPGAQAVQAWAQWTNGRGGVAGHRVEVIVADDGGDPARYRALLQQLVERDGVIAVVYSTNWLSGQRASIEYLEQRRVPVIGGDKLNSFWYQSPMLFPDASANTALIWNHMVEASRQGKRKVGWISCADLQLCRDTDAYWAQYAPALGLQVAYRGQVSFSQPDFTTECLQARNAGVEVFMLAMDANGESRVAASCARQGYQPIFLIVQTSLELHRQPALDGAVFASYVFPFTADDTPAAREFQAVMRQYAPGVPIDDHTAAGWTSARLFERAAAGIAEPPTSAQILEGLWSFRGENLGGLTLPLTFERDRPAPISYGYWPMTIRDGRWQAPQGSQPVSQPPKG